MKSRWGLRRMFHFWIFSCFWECDAKENRSKSKSLAGGKEVVTSPSPPQYYFRGGFRLRQCRPMSQLQVQSFSESPRIWVRYDGRHFNSSFATLRKASVRENMLHISCNAKYPVTLLPNPLIMVDKSLVKSFEDNMDTQCNSEPRPKSPCTNYTVATYIPIHLLYLSIDTQCQSFCKQVVPVTQLRVMDSKGIIFGNITYGRRSLPSGDKERKPVTTSPPYFTFPQGDDHDQNELDEVDNDSNNLVQIYVSPFGTSGKSWIVKCSTDSDLTAKGAALLMKLDTEFDPFLIKEAKEYRKAGIHTIRATFNLPTEDVDYVHCLFPRLDDFLWISRHTSIHFHDPISYWECILRLCGAFLCSFAFIGGICFVIHKWLHSDCCAKKGPLSSSTSQSQLSLRYNSQRSIGGGGGHGYSQGSWEGRETKRVVGGDEDDGGGGVGHEGTPGDSQIELGWEGSGSGSAGPYNSQVSLRMSEEDDGGNLRMAVDNTVPSPGMEEDTGDRGKVEFEDEVDAKMSEGQFGGRRHRHHRHRNPNEFITAQSTYGTISCHL